MTIKSKIMRLSPSPGGDIISNLPIDAMENILTRIPLRDAVRTSVLSRSWRYKWTNIPYLMFNRDMFRGSKRMITHNMLVIALYEVAFHYHGTPVRFVLFLPGLKSCPQIDQVISHVSKNRGFKEFALHILEGDERHKLPLSMYSWVEVIRMTLKYCVIDPPIWFKGFSRLVTLVIDDCSIQHDVLSGLISSSPILEILKVASPIPTEGSIEISAPNLQKLSLTGVFPYIYFKYTPRLCSCVVKLPVSSVPVEGTYSNIFQSLHNLSAIKNLTLSYYYVGNKPDRSSVPAKLTTTFSHLIFLTLAEISFCLLNEVSNVLCLIRSSPNLVKLAIAAYALTKESDVGLENVLRLFQAQEWSEVNLYSLKEVKFYNVFGTPSELGFIELLLTISPVLETMIIRTDHNKVALKDRYEITTKVMGFRRVSPLAKILYLNKNQA